MEKAPGGVSLTHAEDVVRHPVCFLLLLDRQSQLQTPHFLCFSAAIFPTAQVHSLVLCLLAPGPSVYAVLK